MRIIRCDDNDRELIDSNIVVAEKVNSSYGKSIVELLNINNNEDGYYYELVEDDHKLYNFETDEYDI